MIHQPHSFLTIPFDAWLNKKQRILLLYPHLCMDDLRLVHGGEDDLLSRLQVLLFMARRAVIDLIRGA
jgi:hypothetical protein